MIAGTLNHRVPGSSLGAQPPSFLKPLVPSSIANSRFCGQFARLAALIAATCLARLWSARGETEPAQGVVSEQLAGLASAKDAARLPVVQAARAALEALRNPLGNRECVS